MMSFSSRSRLRPPARRSAAPGLAPLSTGSAGARPPAAAVVDVTPAEPQAALGYADSSGFADTQPEAPEERAARGWNDSSTDLRRGLEVIENLPLEALPEHLRPGGPRRR